MSRQQGWLAAIPANNLEQGYSYGRCGQNNTYWAEALLFLGGCILGFLVSISLTNKDDTVPRLSWGKYFEQDGKLLIPINVQAHHAFIDGDHMGVFFETLQKSLNDYSTI